MDGGLIRDTANSSALWPEATKWNDILAGSVWGEASRVVTSRCERMIGTNTRQVTAGPTAGSGAAIARDEVLMDPQWNWTLGLPVNFTEIADN